MGSDKDKQNDMIYGMQMAFGFTEKAGWVLFEGFNVQNGGQFFCALLLILALAIVTEGLTFIIWRQKFTNGSKQEGVVQKVLASLFYFMLRMLNYCQMLVAMTYNFWLILSIAIFQFLAWFVFQDIKDGMVISKATFSANV